jgi:hypothetical protein
MQIADEKNEPIAGAIVSVLNVANNSLVNSAVTDSTGYAEMIGVSFDKEMLKIFAFGYKDYDVKAMPVEDILKVTLSPLNVELGEVIVKASSIVTQKSDRIVFNIANENLTKGNNSYNLIKFTPFIVVDQSDKLSIIGKSGVLLYINGRKTNLPEASIQSYLKSLPAEKIDNIEVITNPGATFRTDGNVGIINLVLKKNEADGLNGTLSLNDSQRKTNSQDGSIYLNYQKNKLNVSANVYGDNTRINSNEVDDYYYIASNGHQRLIRDEIVRYKELSGSVRADYNLSDRQVLGLVLNGSYVDYGGSTVDRTSFGQRNAIQIDSMLYSDNLTKTPTQNYSANLNYRLKINEKGDLSVDVDYLRNMREQYMQTNFARIEAGAQLPPHDRFEQTSEDDMNSYSGKIEYKHTFNNTTNLTAGIETYASAFEADFFYGNWQNNAYVNDPQKTNTFSYNEAYRAGYISFSRVWTPKFNSRIAARLESVDSKGIQQVTSEEIKRNYVDLLPTVSLQYQFNPANRLSFNFSSSASRPGYYSLNPFRFYLTPSTYKEYNPNLKPSKLYINSLNYSLRGKYIFNLSYMYIADCTNNFLIPVDDQYTKYINANYGSNRSFGLSFVWNESFWGNRISINSSLSGEYRKNKGAVESILVDASGFNYVFSFVGNILLSQRYNWNLRSNLSYISPMELAHESVKASYRFSLGLAKNFTNGIALNLGVDNLFFNNMKRSKINDNYEYYLISEPDFRRIYMSVSIPFGNMKAKGASGRSSSSSTVKNRLKE